MDGAHSTGSVGGSVGAQVDGADMGGSGGDDMATS